MALPSSSYCALFQADAARPRLGRASRTAPVSRQTNPNPVWHEPRFHSRPATLPPGSVRPFHPFRLVLSRCRSCEEQNKPETAEKGKIMKLEEIKNRTKLRPEKLLDMIV